MASVVVVAHSLLDSSAAFCSIATMAFPNRSIDSSMRLSCFGAHCRTCAGTSRRASPPFSPSVLRALECCNQQRQVSGRPVPRLRRFSNLHDGSQSANGWCGGFLGFHDFDETETIVLGPDGVEPMTDIASEHKRIRGGLPT